MDVHCCPGPAGARQRGFTLAEALVTVALGALVLTLGVPSLQTLIQHNRLAATVNHFVGALQYARSAAVRRVQHVVLCPSRDHARCADIQDWSDGWIVYVDLNHDRDRDPHEPLLRTGAPLAGGITLHSSRGRRRIRYEALGYSRGTNASFTFCDTRHRAAPRVICLSNTGRPRLLKTACGGKPPDCP